MANYELATAYVQIVPSFRGLQAELTKQLGGLDTDSATTTLGQKLANSLSGVGGALASLGTVAAGTIGAIGGSIGALAAQGGITRALNLEQAEHLFNVLGLGWENYKDIVNDAVKGTRFSLDEAAKIAGNLGASGVTAAEDMSEALRGATGLAATFGSNLSEIGMIYQKVAASGKLSAREVMQFSYQGINVNAALQKSLGKTGEEIKDMVSKGQIDFATFSKAMDENFGTAAKSANDTFVGSLANVKAALSRVGAKFATPGLVALRQIFNSLQPLIDAVAAKIDPLAKKFGELATSMTSGLGEKFANFTKSLQDGQGIIQALMTSFGGLGGPLAVAIAGIGGLGAVFGALGSTIGRFIPGLSGLVGALTGGAGVTGLFANALRFLTGPIGIVTTLFGVMFATSEQFRSSIGNALNSILPVIMQLITTIASALAPIIQLIIGLISDIAPTIGRIIEIGIQILTTVLQPLIPVIQLIGDILALVLPPALEIVRAGFEILATAVQMVLLAFDWLANLVSGVITFLLTKLDEFVQWITSVWNTAWSGIKEFLDSVWQGIGNIVQDGINNVTNFISTLPDTIAGFFSNAGEMLYNAGKSIIDGFLNGLKAAWDGVTGFIGGIGDWIVEHKGPLEKDRKLLIPAGKAIMQSLGTGLNQGLSLYVKPELNDITDEMANARLNTNLMLETVKNRGNFASGIINNYTYNTHVDGAKINETEAVQNLFVQFMQELKRLYVMQGEVQ